MESIKQAIELRKFVFETCEVRVQIDNGEPLFCAADVCRVLGIINISQAVDRLRSDEKHKKIQPYVEHRGIAPAPEIWFVTEPGLYKLVMCSRKPEAERFQDWVTHEVLPSIRKTGAYSVPETREQLLSRAFVEAQKVLAERDIQILEQQKRLESQTQQIEIKDQQIEIKDQKLVVQKPKVDFYEEFAEADGLFNLQGAARALHQPPNKWIRRLKVAGYLFYQNRVLTAYSSYVAAGYFVNRTRTVNGTTRLQTFITPRGLQFLATKKNLMEPS